MDTKRFRALSAHHRALVAIAVLLDGREAAAYLQNDAVNGEVLQKAALDLASQPPELRMIYVGTALRVALGELE